MTYEEASGKEKVTSDGGVPAELGGGTAIQLVLRGYLKSGGRMGRQAGR